MGIEVRLAAFEGPLDLLLHLIEKNKIDIYDIPISEITDQYLEYVEEIKGTDLETMSDFLLVASELLRIKSKMLLPAEKKEGEEIEDPRAELVARLLEYKMYKYSAGLLKERAGESSLMIFKEPTIPKEVREYEEKPGIDEIVGDLTLAKLHSIFDFVIKKQVDKKDPIRSGFGKIKKEAISLSDCILRLRKYGKEHELLNFREYLMRQPDKLHVIVNFLAILEMMKMGMLVAEDTHREEEIVLRFSSDRELTEEEFKQLGEF